MHYIFSLLASLVLFILGGILRLVTEHWNYAILVSLALFIKTSIRKTLKAHGVHSLIWRHFTGLPYDGTERTNAGWFTHATSIHHPSGRAMRWHHRPRAYRALIRTGATGVALVMVWGFVAHRHATVLGSAITCLAGLSCAVVLAARKGRAWFANRPVVAPLALAMAPILGITEQETERAISMSPDWLTRKTGEIGRITLPPRFRADPGQKETLTHLVAIRLPVDVDFRWHTSVNPQRLSMHASPKPPTQVMFSRFTDFMHELKIGEVMLGLDRLSEPYTGMLGNNSDNPHWGLSVNTGRGKSTMLVATAAQILHQDPDAKVLGVDPKMSSLDALAGIPGVTLACDPMNIEQMWTEVDRYHGDMMTCLAEHKRNKLAEFSVNLFLLDEANTCASMWRAYWGDIKTSKDLATPPIWKAIAEIAWMGRAVRKNLVIVGQRLDAAATGGQGMRDSLGLIGLGGVRANQYKMLVDPTGTVPRFPKIKGRWLYYDGETSTWVQNLFPSTDDLREYAMHGRSVPVPV